jgi:class 3 adenylate cyclase
MVETQEITPNPPIRRTRRRAPLTLHVRTIGNKDFQMTQTARIQYVFLDVVGFTKNRSVEAQTEVVATLNAIVSSSLRELEVPSESTVLLPTGDGMAIAMIELPGFDLHLRLAVHILGAVAQHNATSSDPMRRFEVRIGINENIDNVVEDINGRRNVAGAGISMAQRVMDNADGGQVLVGATVYETLRHREHYMSNWRSFTGRGKHGTTFPVYQFVSKEAKGLSVTVPSVFIAPRREPEKLSRFAAYYLAHAIANRDFPLSRKSDPLIDNVALVLLAFLAEDSEVAANTPIYQEPYTITWDAGKVTFEEQYDYYDKTDSWLLHKLRYCIQEKHLASFAELFEKGEMDTLYWAVRPAGVQRLVTEWPQIAAEFGISAGKAD